MGKDIDGSKFRSAEEMVSSIRSADLGDVIRFAVQREGQVKLLDVDVLFGK